MSPVAPRIVSDVSQFHMRAGSILRVIFCGRRSIWRSWRMTPVAPRIVNDVSCERDQS